MEISNIQEGLARFADKLDSQTYLDTFRVTARYSLVKTNSTRANALWKMAQYVVARIPEQPTDSGLNEDHPATPIGEYLKGWKAVAHITNNQILFLETEKDVWKMYDAQGVYMGDESTINNYFKIHKKKRIIQDIEDWSNLPLQQIYYGAPGTGKSHIIKEQTKGKSVIRTTFHPDSDYSTFVGAYKPTTKDVVLRDLSGHIVKEDGQVVREAKIVYEFVSQSFLQAYVSAWKAYAETEQGGTAREQFLVIEEINRGNCAQIFGDLFQLLDRNDQGFSDYPIVADNDMRVQLAKAFAGLQIPHSDAVNSLYDEENIVGKVLAGEILLLPNNLYIRATMNTSDQSLFPIDSAFKRRWDWKYMPISNAGKGWRIAVNGAEYDWWQFLTKVNEYVGGVTNSEDKKLGYFFCKPNGNIIDAEKLVGKVLFYLWNDVFKDYGLNGSLFQATDGGTLTFDKFFDGGTNRINESNVKQFMQNLGVEALESEEVDENTSDGDKNNYRFDGKDYRTKKDFGVSIILKYIQEHPDFTFEELQRNLTLGDSTTWASRFGDGVVAKSDEIQPGYQRYYVVERTSTDNVKYKIYNNWYHDTINYIIDFAKAQGWSVEQCAS